MKKFMLLIFAAATAVLGGFRDTPQNETDLKLPSGFKARIFADDIGRARHMAVTPQGNVFVRLSRFCWRR